MATTGLDGGLKCAPERGEAHVPIDAPNGCNGLHHIADTSCTWCSSNTFASIFIG